MKRGMKIFRIFYVLLTSFLACDFLKTGHKVQMTSDTGILAEYCEEDKTLLDEMFATLNSSEYSPNVWMVGCHRYIEMANQMRTINQSGVVRLVVVARRESLRFVESMLEQSNVQESTAITTNNELMVAGKVQSAVQRRRCKDRAGGRQFWGLVSSLLPDIIDYWQWRNLYLYVDELFGLSEAKQVYAAFKGYHKVASLKMIQTTRTMPIGEFLQQMSYLERGVHEVKAVIVICGRAETLDLAEQASRLGLFSTFYRWLVFDSGSQKLLENTRLQFDTDVVIMRHMEWRGVNASVMTAIETESKNSSSPEESKCIADSSMDGVVAPGNSTIAQLRRYLPQDLLLEFFRVRRRVNNLPSLRSIGTWTPDTGLRIKQDLMPDMDGVVLQVVALHCPPYVIVTKGKGGNLTFEGYLVDVLMALGKIINFRFNVSLPFDHTYGRCEDGICTGIIGFLVRKEADIALANLTPTGMRNQLMDFSTTPVDRAGLSILYRRPSKTDDNIINAYFMPFSMDVSICVGVAIPTIGVALYAVLYFGCRMSKQLYGDDSEDKDPVMARHDRSLGRCLFAALQSFGQQGIDVVPVTGSGRAVFGIMWLFSLFIMSAYTANLISYFTATFVTVPFKSFEEMYMSRKYKVGFMKGTTYMDDIQGENGTLLMTLWKQMEKTRFTTMVEDLEEGLERVRNERYIFMHEARVLEHVASKDCEFATMNERYLSAPMMLAFQKGSQFKRPISEMLLKMSESGLLEKLKNRWWPPTMDCSLASQTFQSISLWGMTSIFGVLAGGLFVGGAVMLVEMCIKAQKLRLRLKALSELAIPDNLTLPNLHIPSLR